MSMWGEEKIQNEKVRNHKEGESMENDWKDKQNDQRREKENQREHEEADKPDSKLLDRLVRGNDEVDNGTSAWTATEKKR